MAMEEKIITMRDKIEIARERVRKMTAEADRLYEKYSRTGETLYKEMAQVAEEESRNTMSAIIKAEIEESEEHFKNK